MSHRWIVNVVPIWLDSGFCTSLKPLSWMRQWNDIEAVVKELPDLDLTSWTKELYSVFASCLILWMLKQWSICPKLFLVDIIQFDRIKNSYLIIIHNHNYLHIPICQCLCQARALSCRFGGWLSWWCWIACGQERWLWAHAIVLTRALPFGNETWQNW